MRQQTLRGAIDWSYDLLDPSEQTLFARLAVFAGGCTLEAAETICAAPGGLDVDVLDDLASLVDKALLRQDAMSVESRFSMLEVIHEYARDRLAASAEVTELRRRHTAFYRELAEAADRASAGSEQNAWLQRLDAEQENVRAALQWTASVGDPQTALAMAADVSWWWLRRGSFTEGRERLEGALAAAPEPTLVRAKALAGAGALATAQGDYAAARLRGEEALAIFREANDRRGVASSLNALGAVARNQAEYEHARGLIGESLAIQRELGNQRGVAAALGNLGRIARNLQDYASARALHEESLAIFRQLADRQGIAGSLGDLGALAAEQEDHPAARTWFEQSLSVYRELGTKQGIAGALSNLGLVALEQGDYGAVGPLLEEGLRIKQELADKRGIANSLESFAGLAALSGQPERAARLFGAVEALRETIGAPIAPSERVAHERHVAAARTGLDDQAFAAAWSEGRTLGLDEVVEYALTTE